MNLSDTLAALANFYADALEGCGRPVCASLRYVGFAEFVGAGACDCTCGPAVGPCVVGDSGDAALSDTGDIGVLSDEFGGYCSADGFVSMGVSAPHTATWTFLLTADEAAALNSYGGVWLRAAIGISPEDAPQTIDADQVTLAVNAVSVDIADLLNVYEGVPGITDMWVWPSNNVFVPVPGMALVAGSNTVVVTSVNRFNGDSVQSFNVVAVDQVGVGADGSQVGDLTFAEGTGCLVACAVSEAPQGSLRVTWHQVGPSERPPTLQTLVSGGGFGAPWVQVKVRVMRCWPTKDDTPVSAWDAAAAGIADDAWCLTCAAQRLIVCKSSREREALGVGGCSSVGGYLVEPVVPSGGCAGSMLTMWVRLSGECP